MCHKIGGNGLGWEDYPTMHEPGFDPNAEGLIAAALFEPLDNTNNIREHVEWDKVNMIFLYQLSREKSELSCSSSAFFNNNKLVSELKFNFKAFRFAKNLLKIFFKNRN